MNQYLNFSLEGKVALVTGASYGIGFAIASAFAEQGATICFNDINQELVDKGLASYAEKGIKAHAYVTYDNLTATLPVATGIVLHEPDTLAEFASGAAYMTCSDPTTGADNGRIFVGAAFPAGVREVKPAFFTEEERPSRGNAYGHLLAFADYEPGVAYTYYWGFAWSRADIPTFDGWNQYMADFARRVRHPLAVRLD